MLGSPTTLPSPGSESSPPPRFVPKGSSFAREALWNGRRRLTSRASRVGPRCVHLRHRSLRGARPWNLRRRCPPSNAPSHPPRLSRRGTRKTQPPQASATLFFNFIPNFRPPGLPNDRGSPEKPRLAPAGDPPAYPRLLQVHPHVRPQPQWPSAFARSISRAVIHLSLYFL